MQLCKIFTCPALPQDLAGKRTPTYISLGCQCLPAMIFKELNLRFDSYPFDWVLSSPAFVYEMLRLLLDEDLNVDQLVRSHFFRNDARCWYDDHEHYKITPNGRAVCNSRYDVVFPHDRHNEENISKYKRRFLRLKERLLDTSTPLRFVWISQSSLTKGNFTLDGKEVVTDVFENLNKICALLSKYHSNFDMLVYDAVQNERPAHLNSRIIVSKISPAPYFMRMKKEVKDKIVNSYLPQTSSVPHPITGPP